MLSHNRRHSIGGRKEAGEKVSSRNQVPSATVWQITEIRLVSVNGMLAAHRAQLPRAARGSGCATYVTVFHPS